MGKTISRMFRSLNNVPYEVVVAVCNAAIKVLTNSLTREVALEFYCGQDEERDRCLSLFSELEATEQSPLHAFSPEQRSRNIERIDRQLTERSSHFVTLDADAVRQQLDALRAMDIPLN